MVSLFPKFTSLTNLTYSTFRLGGLMTLEGNLWITLYMAYQRIMLHVTFISTELLIGGKEVNHIVSSLSTSLIATLSLAKFYLFMARRNQIFNIFRRLENARLKMLKNEEDEYLVTKSDKVGKTILFSIILMYFGFSIVSFTVNAVIEVMTNFNKKDHVIKVWLPWSRENTFIDILSNGLVALMALSVRSVFIGYYSMEVTFTLYSSAYIKTLQKNLINEGIRNQEIYEHHKVIIHLIKDYNEILSGQMYLEILIAPLIPGGFALTFIRGVQKGNIGKTLISSVKLLIYLLPCFVSCCCGQEIINQMEKLHEISYMSNWYEEKPKIRRDFLMMKMQTAKPTSINYRSFVTYDHVLLLAVIKVIYSFFTMIINVDEG